MRLKNKLLNTYREVKNERFFAILNDFLPLKQLFVL